MKKIMTLFVSLACFGALSLWAGDAVTNVVSFEDTAVYVAGSPLALTNDDAGVVMGAGGFNGLSWRATKADAILTNMEDAVITTYGEDAQYVGPEAYTNDYPALGSQYLKLDIGDVRLDRYVLPCNKDNDTLNPAENAQPIPADGLYIDTLVKFTAAEEPSFSAMKDADKISITYVEHDGDPDADNDPAWTNFVVCAGYVSGNSINTNYYKMTVPQNFDKTIWHRLSVRAIPDSGNATAPVCFLVYVDGELLEYDKSVSSGLEEKGLNFSSQRWYNNTIHALLPSAIAATGSEVKNITKIGFSGTGSIDNIAFVGGAPEFVSEDTYVNVTLGLGVDSFKVGADTYNVNGLSETNLIIAAGETGFTFFDFTFTNGYNFSELVALAGCEIGGNDNKSVIFGKGNPAVEVKTVRNNFAIKKDGEGDLYASTLTDALANAPDGATIRLMFDYNIEDNEGEEAIITIGKEVVLDLAGRTITGIGNVEDALFKVTTDGSLMVIDSVGGGCINYMGTWSVFMSAGELLIGSSDASDFGPTIKGQAFHLEEDTLTDYAFITKGQFSYAENTADEDFMYYDILGGADGASVIDEEASDTDYWVVKFTPFTYFTITIADESTINDYDVLLGGESIKEDEAYYLGDCYSVCSNDVVTIVATPATGYSYPTAPDGWFLVDGVISNDFTIVNTDGENPGAQDIEIPAALAMAPDTVSFTITIADSATIKSVTTNGAEVAAGTYVIETNAVVTIVATPADDYEFATEPEGWTLVDGVISNDFTMADLTQTIEIPAATAKVVPLQLMIAGSTDADYNAVTNPYVVATAQDFVALQKDVADASPKYADKTIVMTNDVDMAAADAWTGIGVRKGVAFQGVFDGQGHKVTNLTLAYGMTYNGLFGHTSGATVKNLTVEFDGFAAGEGGECGGAVIGRASEGLTLENVTAEGALSGNHKVAGLVVQVNGGATFTDCTNKCAVTSTATAAGLLAIGDRNNKPTGVDVADIAFVRCSNEAAIAGGSEAAAAFFAYYQGMDNVTLDSCVNSAAVTGPANNTAAVIGSNHDDQNTYTIENENTFVTAATDVLVNGSNVKVLGFNLYADDTLRTYYADDAVKTNTTYTLAAAATPVIELAEGDTISFNTNGFAIVETGITAAKGLAVEKSVSGETITFTAVLSAPTFDDGTTVIMVAEDGFITNWTTVLTATLPEGWSIVSNTTDNVWELKNGAVVYGKIKEYYTPTVVEKVVSVELNDKALCLMDTGTAQEPKNPITITEDAFTLAVTGEIKDELFYALAKKATLDETSWKVRRSDYVSGAELKTSKSLTAEKGSEATAEFYTISVVDVLPDPE